MAQYGYEFELLKSDEGVVLPAKRGLIQLHQMVIEFSRNFNPANPNTIEHGTRYEAILDMIESRLKNRKYEKDPISNALFVSEEILFKILCEHPFIDGNKRTAWFAALALLIANLKYYVNKRSRRKYCVLRRVILVSPHKPLEKAKELELLAAWHDETKQNEIYELLIKNGIRIRNKNTMAEQHIREYLRKFIMSWVIEKKKYSSPR